MSDTQFSQETRALLMRVAVPTVVSLLYREGFKNTLMFHPKPLNPRAAKFVGPAYTVRTIAMREDLLEAQASGVRPNLQAQAVEQIEAGSVLTVAMEGETRTAFMGDIMTTYLREKGVAGIVLDGGVSDTLAISEIDMPLFCCGGAATPVTSHRFVIDLETPVSLDGVPVLPGDIVMGDENGVVVIPRAQAESIARAAIEREQLEDFVLGKVRNGAPLAGTYPPSEATLEEYRQWRASHT